MLINLSNHPYTFWGESQKAAAAIFGDTVDLPFPTVDASANEANITSLAREYEEKIHLLSGGEPVTVHIMGEMTLTFALVRRLLSIGIPCLASTTNRTVEEEEQGMKKTFFDFVRFRYYQQI